MWFSAVAGGSYLPAHLLLLGRVDLDVFAERAGVRVALGAAGDLTRVRLLSEERARSLIEGQKTEEPTLLDRDAGSMRVQRQKLRTYLSAENDRIENKR